MAKQEWPENSGSFAPDSGEFSAPIESRYTRERLIGRGGMGEVWQARDRVLRRLVALKVGRPELSESDALRLVREARITASLDHPGIVPVFDAGEDIEGQPFYTMRVVAGQGLDEAMAQAKDPPARKALLSALLRSCEALAFAHQAGVVHRDLKPANIRVGVFGEVQVMDWGLAWAPNEDPDWAEVLSKAGTRTQAGLILGTPAYMAPEQARCETATPASDVWSLGLVLREILSGEKAYPGPSVDQQLAQLLAGPPKELSPEHADPELRAILAKALQVDAGQRYRDAGEMAEDLRAYLMGDRVSAHRYSVKDELGRILERWRWPAGALLAGVIGLGVAGAVGLFQARAEGARLEAVQEELSLALEKADHNLSQALVSQAASAVDRGNWGVAEVLAAQALTLEEQASARGVLAGARNAQRPHLLRSQALPACDVGLLAADVLVCSADGRVEAYDPQDMSSLWRSQIPTVDLQLSENGERLFVFMTDRQQLRLDARTGAVVTGARTVWFKARWGFSADPEKVVSQWNGSGRAFVMLDEDGAHDTEPLCEYRLQAAALLAGDRAVISCGSGHLSWLEDGGFGEGERRDMEVEALVAFPWRLVPNADASQLVLGGMHGEVHVVSATDGRTIWFEDFGDEFIGKLRFSPDGRWLAVDSQGDGAWVVDLASGAKHQLPRDARDMAFSKQGELVVLGQEGLETWSLPLGAPAYKIPGGVVSLDWTEAGLAMMSGNQAAWAPGTGASLIRTPEGAIGNKAVLAMPGGGFLWGDLRKLRRWTPGEEPEVAIEQSVRRLHRLTNGRVFVTAVNNTRVLDADLRPVPGSLLVGFEGAESSVTAEGDFVVVLARGGRMLRLESEGLNYLELGEYPEVQSVALDHSGWPVYLGADRGVSVLTEEGARTPLLETESQVTELAVSPDGRLLAVAGSDRVIRMVETESGAVLGLLRGHTRPIAALRFSVDGSQLASGAWDDRVLIWDMAALEVDAQLALEQAQVRWGLTPESALD